MPTKGPDFGHLADWAFDSGMKCVRCAMLCASPGGRMCSNLRNMELPSGFLKRGSEWMITDLIFYSVLSARKWYKSYQILLSLDKISKVHYSNLPRHPKLFQWSSQATPQKCWPGYIWLPEFRFQATQDQQCSLKWIQICQSKQQTTFVDVSWSMFLQMLTTSFWHVDRTQYLKRTILDCWSLFQYLAENLQRSMNMPSNSLELWSLAMGWLARLITDLSLQVGLWRSPD